VRKRRALKMDNWEIRKLAIDLGKEVELLRNRNEELLKEVEHWKIASRYNLHICRNKSNLIGELNTTIKHYEEIVGAIESKKALIEIRELAFDTHLPISFTAELLRVMDKALKD
jgi:hypothetical protein